MAQKMVTLTIELPSRDYKQIESWAQTSVRTIEQQTLYFIREGILRERQTANMRYSMDGAAERAAQSIVDADEGCTPDGSD